MQLKPAEKRGVRSNKLGEASNKKGGVGSDRRQFGKTNEWGRAMWAAANYESASESGDKRTAALVTTGGKEEENRYTYYVHMPGFL